MFINSYYGSLLDKYPGLSGYKLIFASMVGLCVIGLVCGIVLYRMVYNRRKIKEIDEGISEVVEEEVIEKA